MYSFPAAAADGHHLLVAVCEMLADDTVF